MTAIRRGGGKPLAVGKPVAIPSGAARPISTAQTQPKISYLNRLQRPRQPPVDEHAGGVGEEHQVKLGNNQDQEPPVTAGCRNQLTDSAPIPEAPDTAFGAKL